MSRSEPSAPPAAHDAEVRERADALRGVAPGTAESEAALARLTESVLRAFAESARESGAAPLPADHRLTATDVAIVCSHLLQAVDLEVFELGLWRSWAGSPGAATVDPRQMRGMTDD